VDGDVACAGVAAVEEGLPEDWGNTGATRSNPAKVIAAKRLASMPNRSIWERIPRWHRR
jgi:hypothetical protein